MNVLPQVKHTASALAIFNLSMLFGDYDNVDTVSCMGCITILLYFNLCSTGICFDQYVRPSSGSLYTATIHKGRHNRSHSTTNIPAQPHFSTRLNGRKFPLNSILLLLQTSHFLRHDLWAGLNDALPASVGHFWIRPNTHKTL